MHTHISKGIGHQENSQKRYVFSQDRAKMESKESVRLDVYKKIEIKGFTAKRSGSWVKHSVPPGSSPTAPSHLPPSALPQHTSSPPLEEPAIKSCWRQRNGHLWWGQSSRCIEDETSGRSGAVFPSLPARWLLHSCDLQGSADSIFWRSQGKEPPLQIVVLALDGRINRRDRSW